MNSNFSAKDALEQLSTKQKAELILDQTEDEAIIRRVFANLTESNDDELLNEFFQAFTKINKQRNITVISNPGVRDTILNLTLTALAPKFVDFEPEDFQLWFQGNLFSVMASLHPGSLVVIPSNISCASYAAILTGLRDSLKSLPLPLSHGVRSSIESLKKTFTRCSVPDSFMCKQTPVDEDLICVASDRAHLQQILSVGNSSEALCNFTITEHACSSATRLKPSNLVTLLNCSLESQRIYPVEMIYYDVISG
ncbi:hypothetical protein D5F01_LYC11371 [Larimichthys crocea]|uniref:Uncharacterized protein n=1 Tax=Larimichthys crocea TaxID=215358 RepID=A0A6G0IDU7_LARCR|nr:hypothetical protein D5F01_LYC11371 [Larimichthys crocea]